MITDLKPCPHPRCENIHVQLRMSEASSPIGKDKHWCACPLCGYEGPTGRSEEEATEIHNEMPRQEDRPQIRNCIIQTKSEPGESIIKNNELINCTIGDLGAGMKFG